MLQTIKVINKKKETFLIKNINNIKFIHWSFKHTKFIIKGIYKKINIYFAYAYVCFFLRLIWKGKAFRVRFFKKNKKFTFNFGHSHWCKITYNENNCYFFKVKRQNYVVFFYRKKHFNYIINFFNIIRFLNKYTKRGLKVKQTPYIKRFGKISQVNSSLHSF